MNRKWTNRFRFVLDECIPPVIRDSRWFMYPFYYWAYRGRNIADAMDFKKKYFEWDAAGLENFYSSIHTISSDRKTDCTESCIQRILEQCKGDIQSVLDVGCGKGYLLSRIQQAVPQLQLHGVDLVEREIDASIPFTRAEGTQLPFADNHFDLVVCTHTIEHIFDARKLVQELKRVAAKKIIVVTPKQRYYYYTLDEHVNFFPQKELLTALIDMPRHSCKNIDGDWIYIGYL